MRAFILVGVAAASVLAGCTCATSVERDAALADATAAQDAGSDVSIADAGTDSFADSAADSRDLGICMPTEGRCSTDADCVAWGAAVAPSGTYVVTMCAFPDCTVGVTDCHPTAASTACACTGTTYCQFGEICVSDTPGGTPRCATQCQGR